MSNMYCWQYSHLHPREDRLERMLYKILNYVLIHRNSLHPQMVYICFEYQDHHSHYNHHQCACIRKMSTGLLKLNA